MTTERDFPTYVITEPCVGLKDATCVEVCPVDCIESSPEEDQFYINPELCIACEQCVLVCPVDAIYLDTEVPPQWQSYIEKNAAFFLKSTEGSGPVSSDEAAALISGAKQRAIELGLSVTIIVLALGDRVVAQECVGTSDPDRDERARNKAYTAMALDRRTSQVNERMVKNAADSVDRERIVMEPGGFPIGKPHISGAVAIAGGTSEQDQECGLAALAARNRWEVARRERLGTSG